MNRLIAYGVTLCITLTCIGNYWSSHWYTKYCIMMWIFSLGISALVARRSSWFFFPIIAWGLCSGIYMFAWSFGPYHQPGMDKVLSLAIEKNSAYTFISFLAACLTLAFLPTKYMKYVKESIVLLLILSAVATVLGTVPVGNIWQTMDIMQDAYKRGGFSGNASMNGCLIACLIPFGVEILPDNKWGIAVIFLSIAGILLTETMVPVGTLAVVALAFAFASGWLRFLDLKMVFFFSCAVLALLWFGRDEIPNHIITGDGRFRIWGIAIDFWRRYAHWSVGMGFGSARTLMPVIQSIQGRVGGEFYLWFHSDWLQTLWELGIVGLVSAFIAWIELAFLSLGRPYLFASFMGFTACAVFNYPLRLPLHGLCITLLVWIILKDRKGGTYEKENHHYQTWKETYYEKENV